MMAPEPRLTWYDALGPPPVAAEDSHDAGSSSGSGPVRTGDVLISGCAIARDAFLLRSEAKPSEKT